MTNDLPSKNPAASENLGAAATAIVMCTYHVDPAKESQFRTALALHWPTLRRLELVTELTPTYYRRVDIDLPTYVEIFEWVPGGDAAAHDHPDVLAIWEPLVGSCASRNGRPPAEFPHFVPVDVG